MVVDLIRSGAALEAEIWTFGAANKRSAADFFKETLVLRHRPIDIR